MKPMTSPVLTIRANRFPNATIRRIATILFMIIMGLAAFRTQAYTRAWKQVGTNGPATGNFQDFQSSPSPGAVVFQNKIYAKHWVGGLLYMNYSILASNDGIHWTTILNRGPRMIDYDRLLVFRDKLWLVGGASYYSSDGIHWTSAGTEAPFGNEPGIAVHNNKMWRQVYGLDRDNGLWNSNDGITWSRINATAPCLKRYGASLISFAGKLWLIGGYDYSETKHDVWSSTDGITWQQVSSLLPMAVRRYPAVVVFENQIWMLGGYTDKASNDVWRSGDGKNWTRVNSAAPWAPRANPTALVYNNRLLILGEYQRAQGNAPATLLRDVWSLDPLASGKPGIAPIANQQLEEGTAFTGPEPVLTQGSLPITWTLPLAPGGMTINPQTGIGQWAAPTAAGSPHSVTLRAVNSSGLASASFKLTVNPLRPRLSAPPRPLGTQCTVSWSAVPGITGYTIQRDDAPDFASPVKTVTMPATTRQATFTGLADGQTSWYRVRGNRPDGVSNAWSNTVAATQDSLAPSGTVKINGGAASVNALLVNLTLQTTDPGTRPSGVARMRFSQDGVTWTAWGPYATGRKFLFKPGATSAYRVYVQFQDLAGNISAPASATTTLNALPICVDAAAGLAGEGTATRPFRSIVEALSGATAGKEVYVAQGRYLEQGGATLKTGMKLLGGFPGNTFIITKRDPRKYLTTMTVAVNPALPNQRPVFVTMDSISAATLDGFRLDGQRLGAYGDVNGIFCRKIDRSCRIANCLITNYVGTVPGGVAATSRGGGITCSQASPVISDCVIEKNQASVGGGIYLINQSAPPIENCVIRNNFAQAAYVRGPFGAILAYGGDGGGIYCLSGAAPVVRNCVISGNSASHNAYGIFGNRGATQNCTLFNNGIGLSGCLGQLRNNIVWGNAKGQITLSATPSYSLIQGWSGGGTGNISADPQFVNVATGDFHLWPTSPAIDAGGLIPGLTTDLEGTPRGILGFAGARGDGSHYDMGAYEYRLPAPYITPATGAYPSPLTVTIYSPAETTVRYTLDGSNPTATSPIYTWQFTLTGTPGKRVTVTARIFKSGLTPSPPSVRVYTFR